MINDTVWRRALAPDVVLAGVWTIVVGLSVFADKEWLLFYHGIDTIWSSGSILWIVSFVASFSLGVRTRSRMRIRCPTPASHLLASRKFRFEKGDFTVGREQLLTWAIMAVCVLVAFWTLQVSFSYGGPIGLFTASAENWGDVRNRWIEAKPFPGARLLYATLVGLCVALADAVLARRGTFDRRSVTALLWATATLFSISILIAQRLLLGHLLVSLGVVWLAHRQLERPSRAAVVSAIALLTVWTGKEIVRGGFLTIGAGLGDSLAYSWNRLLFYFANNTANVTAAVQGTERYSGGLLTVGTLSPTVDQIYSSSPVFAAAAQAAGTNLAGGGTYTAVGVPYVDFGPLGLIFAAGLGFAIGGLWMRAWKTRRSVATYALVMGGVVFSFQTPMWAMSYFWTSLAVASMARYRSTIVPLAATAPASNE